MGKVQTGAQNLIYPMPALLVGSVVDGGPNFMAVAWGGIANGEPPMISVAMRHIRHTLKGIRQNMAFSVNVPSTDMVRETDFCGITTGAKVNKVAACKFRVFYGKLDKAPLIEQCPVNLECKVVQILDLGSHSLVIGRIEETHVTDLCLTDGKPDIRKIKPFIYDPARQYFTIGEFISKSHSIGNEIKAK